MGWNPELLGWWMDRARWAFHSLFQLMPPFLPQSRGPSAWHPVRLQCCHLKEILLFPCLLPVKIIPALEGVKEPFRSQPYFSLCVQMRTCSPGQRPTPGGSLQGKQQDFRAGESGDLPPAFSAPRGHTSCLNDIFANGLAVLGWLQAWGQH